jgi:hypothetical protein
MEPNKDKSNENNDKALERAREFDGLLPEDTKSEDLFSNDVDDLEDAALQTKFNDNPDLAARVAAYFGDDNSRGASGPPGAHRGHVTDPAHDHRLKQNHDRSDNSVEHDDDKDHEDENEAVNESYQKAEERKIEEHKRLLEQNHMDNGKELSMRQHEVNMQNAFSPTASLLNKVKNHEVFGSEMSRRITNKPTIASLNSARNWLKEKVLSCSNDAEKRELYSLLSKVASLLVEAGALNSKLNG